MTKTIFDEARPEMFRLFLREAMEDLTKRLKRGQKWTGGATCQRVRALARQMARGHMKTYRNAQREKVA